MVKYSALVWFRALVWLISCEIVKYWNLSTKCSISEIILCRSIYLCVMKFVLRISHHFDWIIGFLSNSPILQFGLSIDNEKEKFSALPPSSHGSLSSITATSIASSEDPKGGGGGNGGDRGNAGFDRKPSKVVQPTITQEEWWKTTLQVSIPFFIAGLGTIGAGLILGRVEVRTWFECVTQSILWTIWL